jgi:hypothetical protein
LCRIAVGPCADAGKRQRPQLLLPRNVQAARVAASQQHRLSVISAVPRRTHSVNHVQRRQLVAARQFRLAGLATAKQAAFLAQFRPCREMDRSSKPPPPSGVQLAAFTIASTASSVMSPRYARTPGVYAKAPELLNAHAQTLLRTEQRQLQSTAPTRVLPNIARQATHRHSERIGRPFPRSAPRGTPGQEAEESLSRYCLCPSR